MYLGNFLLLVGVQFVTTCLGQFGMPMVDTNEANEPKKEITRPRCDATTLDKMCPGVDATQLIAALEDIETSFRMGGVKYEAMINNFKTTICSYENLQTAGKLRSCLLNKDCWNWKILTQAKSVFMKNVDIPSGWATQNLLLLYMTSKYDLCISANQNLQFTFFKSRSCSARPDMRGADQLFQLYQSCTKEKPDTALYRAGKKYLIDGTTCNNTAALRKMTCHVESYLVGRKCTSELDAYTRVLQASSTTGKSSAEQASDKDLLIAQALQMDGLEPLTLTQCERLSQRTPEKSAAVLSATSLFLLMAAPAIFF